MRRALPMLVRLSVVASLQPQPLFRQPRLAAVAARMLCAEDLSKLTVVALKERLRAAGLPVSGRKAELIVRLGGGGAPAAAPAAASVFAPTAAALSATADALASSFPPIEIEACKS